MGSEASGNNPDTAKLDKNERIKRGCVRCERHDELESMKSES